VQSFPSITATCAELGVDVRFWPIATDIALQPNVRFWGKSGTSHTGVVMSAYDPKRTLGALLDHIVGRSKQRRRYCETERLCGFEI
jgi:hypothetical protein